MRTIIKIADSLLTEAKKMAKREKTTVHALVEQALRKILAERKSRKSFRLRKASFKGKGIQLTVENVTGERSRELL